MAVTAIRKATVALFLVTLLPPNVNIHSPLETTNRLRSRFGAVQSAILQSVVPVYTRSSQYLSFFIGGGESLAIHNKL